MSEGRRLGPGEPRSAGAIPQREFHRLGRKIGVFASCPLMEAASVGSFQLPSWRNWSGVTPAEIPSRLASILSQARRPEASSVLDWRQDIPPRNYVTSMLTEGMKSSQPL